MGGFLESGVHVAPDAVAGRGPAVTQIALSEAQQNLAELVKAVGRGEEFVITVDGAPAAIVSPPEPTQVRRRPRLGSAQGQIWMSEDFDAPLDDFADYR